jgi:hypothetical protein
MSQFTKPISFTGGTWSNLLTRMQALGYKGGGRVSTLNIFNGDAANLIYLHLTDNGSTSPSTGTDGWPIGGAATASGKTFGSDSGTFDLGTAWVYAAVTVSATVMVTGS